MQLKSDETKKKLIIKQKQVHTQIELFTIKQKKMLIAK